MKRSKRTHTLQAAAVDFIERHAPKDEISHNQGGWGNAFYSPVEFCNGLEGRKGAAWKRIAARFAK